MYLSLDRIFCRPDSIIKTSEYSSLLRWKQCDSSAAIQSILQTFRNYLVSRLLESLKNSSGIGIAGILVSQSLHARKNYKRIMPLVLETLLPKTYSCIVKFLKKQGTLKFRTDLCIIRFEIFYLTQSTVTALSNEICAL